jgi:hypothetical protein
MLRLAQSVAQEDTSPVAINPFLGSGRMKCIVPVAAPQLGNVLMHVSAELPFQHRQMLRPILSPSEWKINAGAEGWIG